MFDTEQTGKEDKMNLSDIEKRIEELREELEVFFEIHIDHTGEFYMPYPSSYDDYFTSVDDEYWRLLAEKDRLQNE